MKRTWRDDFIYPIYKRAYSVRVPMSTGVLHSKYFAVAKRGGHRAALRAARLYRDKLLAQISRPPPRRLGHDGKRRPVFSTEARGNNATGFIGVYTDGLAWRAFYYRRPTKQRARSFSIMKYGHDEARAKAVAWRAKMIKAMR